MTTDSIAEIGIDEQERLYLRPATATFPYIYREALDVHWEPSRNHLHSPKPREWTYFQWFQHIIDTAALVSFDLHISAATKWTNIPDELRLLMQSWDSSRLPATTRVAEYRCAAAAKPKTKLP